MSDTDGGGNYFREYLARCGAAAMIKMDHFMDIYRDVMAPWRGRDISFLEIGVFQGGSLPMWRGYFGDGARLTFLDINPDCRRAEIPGTRVEIGDQSDPAFLARIAAQHGPFDIIIDDGGHIMNQQITSFNGLWRHLVNGGLYIVEDTHTSYWPGFGGGFREPGSFIEFAKDLIDRMHSWYTDQDAIFPLHPAARELGYVHFYDSLVVMRKQLKDAPKWITARNGRVSESRRMLEARNRKPIL